jgi:hypothetical protein
MFSCDTNVPPAVAVSGVVKARSFITAEGVGQVSQVTEVGGMTTPQTRHLGND